MRTWRSWYASGKRKLKNVEQFSPKLTSRHYLYWAITLIAGMLFISEATYNARMTGLASLSVVNLMMGYAILYMHFNWEWLLSKRACKLCGRHIEKDWECGLKVLSSDVCLECVKRIR